MKKVLITSIFLSVIAINFLPSELSAIQTADDSFSKAITEHTTFIQSILFGPLTKMIGVAGGAWGLIRSILSSSITPLVTFGGIGLYSD